MLAPMLLTPRAGAGERHPLQTWLHVQIICLGVAVLLRLLGTSSFLTSWLYSALIGSCCWALIHGGVRLVLARRRTQRIGWAVLLPLIVLGSIAGFVLGTLAGDAITGYSSALPLRDRPAAWAGVLSLSLAAALGATLYFHSRSRIATVEQQAAETQLRLLQSQLEPHMLFNTLANLRVLIATDPPRAQAMLDRLIAFLRSTLAASRLGEHPLEQEFQRLADYLALIAVRMGPRLTVQLTLPPALAALPVPALLLQPLVENAVQHGLEPQLQGGRITVSAQAEGRQLLLTVQDNGAGLPAPSALPPPAQAGRGFGLTQVRERLAALYGRAASLSLQAAPGGGTLAQVRLPLPTGDRT